MTSYLYRREVTTQSPTWEEVKCCLIDMKDGESITVGLNDDTWLIVLHIREFGYLVSGCAVGDRDYYNLIDRTLGDEPVTAFDGGNTNDYPRYSFVGVPLLLKALETFYLTGQRDPACDWVDEEDAFYGSTQ